VRASPLALTHLKELIEDSSSETREEITIDGVLMGIDVTADTFRIAVADGEDIRGRLANDFDRMQHWAVLTPYSAVLDVCTKVSYATDIEVKTYILKELRLASRE
jgi:hypothetical protein